MSTKIQKVCDVCKRVEEVIRTREVWRRVVVTRETIEGKTEHIRTLDICSMCLVNSLAIGTLLVSLSRKGER